MLADVVFGGVGMSLKKNKKNPGRTFKKKKKERKNGRRTNGLFLDRHSCLVTYKLLMTEYQRQQTSNKCVFMPDVNAAKHTVKLARRELVLPPLMIIIINRKTQHSILKSIISKQKLK